MPTQAEIDAAKAAKEKKNSNNIVVASGGEADFRNGKVYGDPKVVGTSGPGGFDAGLPKVKRTYANPGEEGEVHDSWDDIKRRQNEYQLELARQHEAGGSGSSSTTSSSTSGGDSSKKSGGAVSYKDSYTDAVASKWESKGGYDAYEKAAKAWNEKKYGTTNPTADAKTAGITKDKLAKEHTANTITKVERIEPKQAAPIATKTQANNRMQQAVASANAPASLLGGTQTRREIRQANRQQRQADRQTNRQQRQADRQTNRDNKAANRIRNAGQKAVTKRANKERRQDARQERGDKRFERKTGISMSGTPTYSPQLDTGPGTYQGAQTTKGSNLVKAVQSIASANKKTPSKPTKKTGGEFWGKSGPIK